MNVWYHGTNKKNYKKILKTGLKIGTYFTQDLGSALTMGGPYIFIVTFKEQPTKCWEWISNDIVIYYAVVKYKSKVVYYNFEEQLKIHADVLKENGINNICKSCFGVGEIKKRKYHKKGQILLIKKRNKMFYGACPECKGFGGHK